ncbi:MAG: hypothetical protein MK082_03840 [Phycisphaerales bacterium]|nr:hypothetical protein [Phycisphaerales bacterium]
MYEGTTNKSSMTRSVLELAEGDVVMSALDALLKGVLESEVAVDAVFAPIRGPFSQLAGIGPEHPASRLLQSHGTRLELVNEPGRAIELAARTSMPGCNTVLLLAAGDVLRAATGLARARSQLEAASGYGMVLVIEDDLESSGGAAPARLLDDLGIARIEPNDVTELRDMIEAGIRLSRAGNGPTAILASSTLLRSLDTIGVRPNRVVETLDAAVALRGRRRLPRGAEGGDLLRLARRLELNQVHGLPSPGECAPLGLVTIGPTHTAADHLLRRFNLTGRVPLLKLGMPAPLDESIIERMLARCEQLVVLEGRPGLSAPEILAAAEAARRKGIKVATVWWRELPDRDGVPVTLETGDALRSSRLARKIAHLLDSVSSGSTVTQALKAPDPQFEQLPVPPRGGGLGVEGAVRTVRNLLIATSQWLEEREEEPEGERVGLVLEEELEGGQHDRVVHAEIWTRERFLAEGPAVVRECARDRTDRLLVVCDVGGVIGTDLVRLATASVPDQEGIRVSVTSGQLDDLDAFLEMVRESSLNEGVTIIVARDGSPPRFDRDAIERSFREVDELGFTPVQRIIRPADQACSLRPPLFADLLGTGLDRQGDELETSIRYDRLPRRLSRGVLFRVRPHTEQVEVLRTRPPIVDPDGRSRTRPSPPTLRHATASTWRCHIAGLRGSDPGLAARILCTAGREMGYRVGCLVSPEQSGPARSAWAQVLFSRPREGSAPTLPIAIPYGEADLLVGVDPVETLRSLGPDPALRVAAPDRTDAVVNTGLLADQVEHSSVRLRRTDEALEDAIRQRCREESWCVDLVALTRRSLLTERLLDMLLLGVAYQRGTLPLSLESLENAIESAEENDFGRLLVAFRYGRTLESGRGTPRDEAPRVPDIERVVRRLVRDVRASGFFRRRDAARLEELITGSLEAMPGLAESELGRPATVDFAVGVRHALAWGGMVMANRFARLVRDLYEADSGARARRMTCYAIYPLAEAMMIRDPLFVATMATGLEQRRRIRERLAVRHARGDVITRRYLTRIELVAGRRRARFDLRSSDWPAKVVASLVGIVPAKWRGSAADRALSEATIALVERATRESHANPEKWERILLRLNIQAEMGHLRSMSGEEIEGLLGE